MWRGVNSVLDSGRPWGFRTKPGQAGDERGVARLRCAKERGMLAVCRGGCDARGGIKRARPEVALLALLAFVLARKPFAKSRVPEVAFLARVGQRGSDRAQLPDAVGNESDRHREGVRPARVWPAPAQRAVDALVPCGAAREGLHVQGRSGQVSDACDCLMWHPTSLSSRTCGWSAREPWQ